MCVVQPSEVAASSVAPLHVLVELPEVPQHIPETRTHTQNAYTPHARADAHIYRTHQRHGVHTYVHTLHTDLIHSVIRTRTPIRSLPHTDTNTNTHSLNHLLVEVIRLPFVLPGGSIPLYVPARIAIAT